MAAQLSGTPPDAMPPAHHHTPRDGLGYSRHYAKRIRDIGKSSKDSWILRLWNQMFPKKMSTSSQEAENVRSDFQVQISSSTIHTKEPGSKPPPDQVIVSYRARGLPPPHREGSRFLSPGKDTMSQRLPWNPTNGGRQKILAAELANSPYLSTLQRPNYRIDKTRSSAPVVGSSDAREIKDPAYRRKDTGVHLPRRTAHPYLSANLSSWRPREARAPPTMQLEKRAKATAEKAVTVNLL